MELHYLLRKETQNVHFELEHNSLLKKLGQDEIALSEYREIIKRFYGFIVPCEKQIYSSPDSRIYLDRSKKSLLEDDLLALGISRTLQATIPQSGEIPNLEKEDQILGYLYVMEGSTLGGQIISKHIKNNLHLDANKGLRYFQGYGKNTKAKWDDYCGILNAITDLDRQSEIIKTACLTFSTLYKWMNNF